VLAAIVVVALLAWGVLFLWFSNLPYAPLRAALAGCFAAGTVAGFVFIKPRRRALAGFLVVFAALLAWYFSIPPSNDREWAPECAVLPVAEVRDNLVVIRNIRSFEYRSDTDFTPRYYDRTFDLDKLESLDLVCVYWGIPAAAHVMTSFGFGGGEFICFSIEMRREKDEPGSMLQSFFRKYELIYIAGDERDLIRVRTNYRRPPESAYIYRTRLPVKYQRLAFLNYVRRMNGLAREPEWYHAVQDNCTTGVLKQADAYEGRARYTWKVLLSGFAAEYAYELGMLDSRVPFAELTERGLVNERARPADESPDFSSRIREGVPMPEPYTVQEFHTGH
jgi:hypothetical protein